MEWIPFTSGRLAELGHMTSVDGKNLQLCAEPSMRQGTTATIAIQTAVEVQLKSRPDEWIPAVVMEVSSNGEAIRPQTLDANECEDWIEINSGMVRMSQANPAPTPAKKKNLHRRCLLDPHGLF